MTDQRLNSSVYHSASRTPNIIKDVPPNVSLISFDLCCTPHDIIFERHLQEPTDDAERVGQKRNRAEDAPVPSPTNKRFLRTINLGVVSP